MRFARVLLLLGALVSGGFGIAYLVATEWMGGLVGILLPTATGRADFRAGLGGAELGMALFFALAAVRQVWLRPGLAALGLIVGGYGVARLGSLVLDPARGAAEARAQQLLLVMGFIEIMSAILCAWAYRRVPRSAPRA